LHEFKNLLVKFSILLTKLLKERNLEIFYRGSDSLVFFF